MSPARPGGRTQDSTRGRPVEAGEPGASRSRRKRGSRTMARTMFYSHLWLGVAATAILLLIAITGVLLNHKRGFGLMPAVEHRAAGPLDTALPLGTLAANAAAALPLDVRGAAIDRIDIRPDDGLMKVRFDDVRVMEVTVDLHTGEVLEVGERNDVFLEKLHSGEIFGSRWVLLSDAGAVLLVILLISGYWLWLYPKSRT